MIDFHRLVRHSITVLHMPQLHVWTGPSLVAYSLVWSRVVESPGDPFASLDLAMLGSAHVVSGLSCWGRVMSDVVGSGWTQATGFRTVGVASPGLASLVPLSAGGSGPSRVLFSVILSPLVVFSEPSSCARQPLPWA